jgi:hypothetical protein
VMTATRPMVDSVFMKVSVEGFWGLGRGTGPSSWPLAGCVALTTVPADQTL